MSAENFGGCAIWRWGWVRLAVTLAMVGAAGAQTLPAEAATEMAQRVRAEMDERHIPGLAVMVVREGQTIWTGCFGLADLENAIPVTGQTVFRFASVSKAITAVAAMRLVEAGRLTLDASVTEMLAADGVVLDGRITVRHLLSHQSGLRHYQPQAGREPLRHYNRLADVLRAKAGDAPLFAPGTKFGYTTYGYVVLGRVIELAGGAEFAEQMRAGVFVAAGMKTARVDDLYTLIPHRAQGYFRSLNGEWRNSEPSDLSEKIPGGGLCGTINDLAAFAAALQRGTLLSPATMALMWTPQTLTDGSATSYGLGWYVGTANGRREVYHPGTQAKVSSMLWLSPDDDIAVVILGNLEQLNFLSLARQLGALAREAPVTTNTGPHPK